MNKDIFKRFQVPVAIMNQIEKATLEQGYTGDKSSTEIKVLFKLFNPTGIGTWWIYEMEDDNYCMAFCNLDDPEMAELGSISLNELAAYRKMGIGIELDRSFPIGTEVLSDIIKKVKG